MNRFLALAGVGVLIASAGTARADFLLNLNTVTNGTGPTGSPYTFMTALFKSTGTDTVELTLTNLMPASAFVSFFNFNLDPLTSSTYLSSLTFLNVGGVSASTVTRSWNNITTPSDVQAGTFDIQFAFGSNVLSSGQVSKYQIQGVGLTAESFRFVSLPDTPPPTNLGGYYAAAKIQGYGSSAGVGTKSWAQAPNSVPEPFTMGLGIAAAGVFVRRRMKAKKA